MLQTILCLGPLMLCSQSTAKCRYLVDADILQVHWLQAMLKDTNKKTPLFQKLQIAAVSSHVLEVLSKNPQDRQIDPDRADIYL